MEKELKVRFVANTAATREKGLMFAAPLNPDETVLFAFPYNGRYAFWNKNVPFDLSLAFLDEYGKVVDLVDMEAQSIRQAVPNSENVRYVVEASRGTFARLGVSKGDLIHYQDHILKVKLVQGQSNRTNVQ